MATRPSDLPPPPRSWTPARRLARAFTAPVARFLQVEAAGGLVLLVAAAIALIWANTPWVGLYEALWTTPFGLQLGSWSFERDLRWWVNDGLMTIFFFVVGLEIRREMHAGELADLRRAALPIAAALGGMLVPAAIYAVFNAGHGGAHGWGVPMATDIAFAVGVLALLGDRVPPALRILLLALAVIDDLGAILVIALFYSDGVSFSALGAALLGLGGIAGLQMFGVRSAMAYLPFAGMAWAATYASGVHPTIAGVVVGLMTPVHAWWGPERFADMIEGVAHDLREAKAPGGHELHTSLHMVTVAAREAVPPVERIQHLLHGWVAWGVMPLFAFANAGVSVGNVDLSGDGWRVFVGVVAGLVVGKLLGVWGASRLTVALGLTQLPRGVNWTEMSVVGAVAGIGFTMALFVAQLALPPGPLLETAKLGILTASGIAGVIGMLVGRLVLGGVRAGGAQSEVEAESAAEI